MSSQNRNRDRLNLSLVGGKTPPSKWFQYNHLLFQVKSQLKNGENGMISFFFRETRMTKGEKWEAEAGKTKLQIDFLFKLFHFLLIDGAEPGDDCEKSGMGAFPGEK